MDESDEELQPIVGGRNLQNFQCDQLCAGLSTCKWLLFFIMLLVQFVGLILFSIWDIDCFFREFHTTATFFLIYHVVYHSPEFRSTRTVILHLAKKKYFYKISFVVLVVLIYDVYVILNNPKAWKTIAAVLFIFDKFLTVVLMFLVNFLPRFLSNGESNRRRLLYKVALGLYVLQNFLIALIGSTNAAYKVLTVSQPELKANKRPGPKAIADLMLLITNNGYRYFVANFFFSKLFDETLNILGGGTIEETIANQEVDGDDKNDVDNNDQIMVRIPEKQLAV